MDKKITLIRNMWLKMHYFNIYIFFLIRKISFKPSFKRRVWRFRRSILRRYWANRVKRGRGWLVCTAKGSTVYTLGSLLPPKTSFLSIWCIDATASLDKLLKNPISKFLKDVVSFSGPFWKLISTFFL